MSDLTSLIKNLQIGADSGLSYIYYDNKTGKIHKISSRNIPEDGVEIFEVESKEVRHIMSGERRIDEFFISHDLSAKQTMLKEITYEDEHNTASAMCYQIPIFYKTEATTIETLEHDIVIQQDTINKVWNIRLNGYTEQFLVNNKFSETQKVFFSVTEKYDPNILYRSLEFAVSEFYKQKTTTIPFIYESEHDANNVSIYTAKYFDSYAHEVI